MTGSITRPIGVTVVAVLTLLSGLLNIFTGSTLLIEAGADAALQKLGGASPLIGSGVFTVLLGAALVLLSLWLFRGNSAARVGITVLEALSAIGSFFLVLAHPSGAIGAYASIALALLVISLLWTKRANAFFRRGGVKPSESAESKLGS